MDDIYESLISGASLLNDEEESASGIDAFLASDQNVIKVASIDDLFQVLRIGNDTLIHKSKQDLWKISEDGKGEVVIERLFDPNNSEPLKI